MEGQRGARNLGMENWILLGGQRPIHTPRPASSWPLGWGSPCTWRCAWLERGPLPGGHDCAFCPLPTSSLLRGQLTIVSGLELRLHLRDHWALPRVTFGVESSPVALADGCGPLGQVSSCRKYLEGLKA